jgi:hypothetical protein
MRRVDSSVTPTKKQEHAARPQAMTAQQYLLSQAEHCRRSAADSGDPFVAEELKRLADEFEKRARLSAEREDTTPRAA